MQCKEQVELCNLILQVVGDPGAVAQLAAGELPAGIAAAASRLTAARARAGRRDLGADSPVLSRYGQLAAEFYSANGRAPSIGELAKLAGKSRTPAEQAITRLKKANMWPG